jgi:hypothetical protein
MMKVFYILPANAKHFSRMDLVQPLLRLPVVVGSTLDETRIVFKKLNYFHLIIIIRAFYLYRRGKVTKGCLT